VERGSDNVVGTPGRLDPASESLIAASAGQPPLETLAPDQARRLPLVLAGAPEPVGSVVQRWIDGPGGPLAIRIYRPSGVTRPPAFVYMHGGGWVIGSLEGSDAWCRRLTNAAGCAVLSVACRLAPENKYPAALDDTLAAIDWTVSNADELGLDATQLVVGGNSAGGNLAAAALATAGMDGRARDIGEIVRSYRTEAAPV
jgi:acetyl esterase